MDATPPFWFLQRQCKTEPAGDNVLKATGPNLAEAFLRIEPVGDRWRAALRRSADGADEATTSEAYATPKEAWQAAFELYRLHFIV
jgi:hypothetical protein